MSCPCLSFVSILCSLVIVAFASQFGCFRETAYAAEPNAPDAKRALLGPSSPAHQPIERRQLRFPEGSSVGQLFLMEPNHLYTPKFIGAAKGQKGLQTVNVPSGTLLLFDPSPSRVRTS